MQYSDPGPSRIAQQENVSPNSEHKKQHNTFLPHRHLKIARQPLPLHFSKVYHLSAFTAECPACSAKHWIEERAKKSSMRNPVFTMCCTAGKVHLPSPVHPPAELAHYLLDQSQGKNRENMLMKLNVNHVLMLHTFFFYN
jgi:hypothetical protein